MEHFVWQMGLLKMLGGWRSASTECGRVCVIIIQIVMTLELCADSWVTLVKVRQFIGNVYNYSQLDVGYIVMHRKGKENYLAIFKLSRSFFNSLTRSPTCEGLGRTVKVTKLVNKPEQFNSRGKPQNYKFMNAIQVILVMNSYFSSWQLLLFFGLALDKGLAQYS